MNEHWINVVKNKLSVLTYYEDTNGCKLLNRLVYSTNLGSE